MSAWKISRASYYGDWVTIPILGCIALITDVSYHGLTVWTFLIGLLGFVAWTLAEYGLHRWVFHRVYRREHWMHHIRPTDYVGVPSWQTGILFTMILIGCWGSLGLDLGAGFFLGFIAAYMTYLWSHNLFHHGRVKPFSYWGRRERLHRVHHAKGVEKNFGIITPFWDIVFGTYQPRL